MIKLIKKLSKTSNLTVEVPEILIEFNPRRCWWVAKVVPYNPYNMKLDAHIIATSENLHTVLEHLKSKYLITNRQMEEILSELLIGE